MGLWVKWHFYTSWNRNLEERKILILRTIFSTIIFVSTVSVARLWGFWCPLNFENHFATCFLRVFSALNSSKDANYGRALKKKCVCYSPSRIRLFVTPWTVARQAPLSMGFSRPEYWSGLPCPPPEDLSNPGIEPTCLLHCRQILYHWATGEALKMKQITWIVLYLYMKRVLYPIWKSLPVNTIWIQCQWEVSQIPWERALNCRIQAIFWNPHEIPVNRGGEKGHPNNK